MIPELGHYGLALAVVLAAAQAILPLWGASTRNCRLMAAAPKLSLWVSCRGRSFVSLPAPSGVSDDFQYLTLPKIRQR